MFAEENTPTRRRLDGRDLLERQLQLQSDIVNFVTEDIVNLVMTVVTNKDMVHPEFYTFLHKSSEVDCFEEDWRRTKW